MTFTTFSGAELSHNKQCGNENKGFFFKKKNSSDEYKPWLYIIYDTRTS